MLQKDIDPEHTLKLGTLSHYKDRYLNGTTLVFKPKNII